MHSLADGLSGVKARMAAACRRYGRREAAVRLLAVSKTQPAHIIDECYRLGQVCFGENHLQEAIPKIAALADRDIEWHFIGSIQSNKTRVVAENFAWVHSLDRLKTARRLNDQRPGELPPLQVCLQVNASGEASKSGVTPDALPELARQVAELPRLWVRGLMTIPAPSDDFESQRRPFRLLHELLTHLVEEGLAVDTLSMGMTADLEAAIAEGATLVRVGTAIFGPRSTSPSG